MDQTTPQCVSASSIRLLNLLTSCAALFTPTKNWRGKILLFIAVMVCLPITRRWWWMITSCGVSEIVRGADLIEPTVRQISLYQLFGWQVPDYIHLPLALNPQGAKLSKQNHAPALPKGDPRPVLIAALQFLGQQAEAHWQDFSVEQILQSAVKNWRLTAVPESAIVNSTFSNASC